MVQSAAINTNGINKMTVFYGSCFSVPCGHVGICMLLMCVLTTNVEDNFVLRMVDDVRHSIRRLGSNNGNIKRLCG